MAAASSCTQGAAGAQPSSVLRLLPLGLELQDGDEILTPSPFSLFTDTTPAGGVEVGHGAL